MAERETRPGERRRWTKQEERILVAYYVTFGRHWKKYEEFLPGRTAKQIGAHWDEMVQKEVTGKITKKPNGPNRVVRFDEKKEEEVEMAELLRLNFG
jgi:hypothetical protein